MQAPDRRRGQSVAGGTRTVSAQPGTPHGVPRQAVDRGGLRTGQKPGQRLVRVDHAVGHRRRRCVGRDLLGVVPAHRQVGEHAENLGDEGRGGEGTSARVPLRPGQDEAPGGTSAGDVAVEPLVTHPPEPVRTQLRPDGDEAVAFDFGQESAVAGHGREDALVQAGDDHEGEFRLPGSVDGADDDLVLGRRDDAGGQGGQPGFDHRQPVGEGHFAVSEAQFEAVQPGSELFPGGAVERVDGGLGRGVRGAVGLRGLPPGVESAADAEILPEAAKGGGEGASRRLGHHGRAEPAERFDEVGQQTRRVGEFGRRFLRGAAPGRSVPAAGEGEVFPGIDPVRGDRGQAGLEHGEPILRGPVEGGQAEGAAGQFRDRMMGEGFPAIDEDGDVEPAQHAPPDRGVGIERSQQHRGVPVAAAPAHVPADFPRRHHRLAFGVAAGHQPDRLRRPIAGLARGGTRRGPGGGQVPEGGLARETTPGGTIGQDLDVDPRVAVRGEARVAAAQGAADHRPGREPGRFAGVVAVDAERQGGPPGAGGHRGQEPDLLGSHFGEAVEPQGLEAERRGVPTQRVRRQVRQPIRVDHRLGGQAFPVAAEEQGEVVELVGQHGGVADAPGQFLEPGGAEVMALEFAQQGAEFLGEAGEAGAGTEDAEFAVSFAQHRAQHHQPALLAQQVDRARFAKDLAGETVEGQDLEPGPAREAAGFEEGPLELERRLLGREQQQRGAGRVPEQLRADLVEAAMRFFRCRPGRGGIGSAWHQSRGWGGPAAGAPTRRLRRGGDDRGRGSSGSCAGLPG